MRQSICVFLIFFLVASSSFADESPNYCLDPQTNSEWTALLSGNPNDDSITKLFALRIGLCELVRRNITTLDRATVLFEKERGKAVMERKREILEEKNKTPMS